MDRTVAKGFNLLDEAWLPVRFLDGSMRNLGLIEVFERSSEIAGLTETAPPSLVSEYRLLLAIMHRALTDDLGSWKDRDRLGWYRDGLPVTAVRNYLQKWRERFWLFHPEHPFMQVAALAECDETRDKRKSWTQISLGSATGNAPVMFDHSCDSTPRAISPVTAVRTLLGFLQFTPGGLVKALRDADNGGALMNTAAVVPLGETLAQTLCLTLHTPSGLRTDLPCWEQAPPTIAELTAAPTLAVGPNDRYTRLSRAVQFLPEDGGVRWLRFAAGVALGDDPNARDPMASYRAGSAGMVRFTFAAGRALWRDLPALVPDPTGKASQPAAVLQWACGVHMAAGDPFAHQPVLVAGIASDKAKLLRWRSERIALPLSVLLDPDKTECLRALVRKAEEMFAELRKMGSRMLAETFPDPGSKDTYARAREVFDAGSAAPLYFAGAERALSRALGAVARGEYDHAEADWFAALSDASVEAWIALCATLGQTPRALRAEAISTPRLYRMVGRQLPANTAKPHRSNQDA